jgi:pimeloyl-ACP methyl ester carboxylesterase
MARDEAREIEIDGRQLAYRVTGAGAPAVLLHSGGLTSRQWRRLAETLAASRQVVLPDFLGYGSSTPWPVGEGFDFQLDVDAIVMLVDALEAPVDLVGHSYGGLVAAHVARRRPALVRSLALYEPVMFSVLDGNTPEDERARRELAELDMSYRPDAQGVDEHWLSAFVGWWNGPGAWDGLGDEVRASFRQVAWKLHQEVASLARDTTGRPGFASIGAPTLLLGGERTRPVEKRVLDVLERTLPNARLQLIAGAGHMGPMTHGPAVNDAIAQHIAAHG